MTPRSVMMSKCSPIFNLCQVKTFSNRDTTADDDAQPGVKRTVSSNHIPVVFF